MKVLYNTTLKTKWPKLEPREIVRQIYISFPTYAFEDNRELEFEILNEISNFFRIPFHVIQVVGSAKTGTSYFKNREFIIGESDLDIAIISPELYLRYMEITFVHTKGFVDLQGFYNKPGKSNVAQLRNFKNNLSKGMFRPDLMPDCEEKTAWWEFFEKLSNKHYKLFKNINAGIYMSQSFFEFKQIEGLERYMNGSYEEDKNESKI